MSDAENYPRLLREIPGWQFRRWTYDAAPLEAHRVCRHHGDEGGWSVEIDDAGDLVFDGLDDGDRPCIPPEVLRDLIADAVARRVDGWWTP